MSNRPFLAALLALALSATSAQAQVPFETLRTFVPDDPDAPRSLVLASDGNLYGAAGGVLGGGAENSQFVFRMTPGGALAVIAAVPSVRALSEADGFLYGLNDVGPFRMRLDASGFEQFAIPSGVHSVALVHAPDGSLYGLASGGQAGNGFVYRIDNLRTYSVVHDFTLAEGSAVALSRLALGFDGKLYGPLYQGQGKPGTIFRLTTAGALSVINTSWCVPTELLPQPAGDFYASCNGIAHIAVDGTPTNIGATYAAVLALVAGADGNLYATDDKSMLYRISPSGTQTILHTLTTAEGSNPWALAAAPDGTIYGATAVEGAAYKGSVFAVNPAGTFRIVHMMVYGIEGSIPNSLVQGSDGALYGTTDLGGANQVGTVFRLGTDRSLSVLYAFPYDFGSPLGLQRDLDGTLDVTQHSSLLLMDTSGHLSNRVIGSYSNPAMRSRDGSIYGLGSASVYRFSAGVFKILYTWPLSSQNGIASGQPLIEAADGSLVGITEGWPVADRLPYRPGTLFRISPDRSTFTELHVFNDGQSSSVPTAIALGPDGRVVYGIGTRLAFYRASVSDPADYTVLATLPGTTGPSSTNFLTFGGDGHFYAGTPQSIYRVTSDGAITLVHQLPTGQVLTSLTAGRDGFVYGTVTGSWTTPTSGEVFRVATPEAMALDVPGDHVTTAQPFDTGGWAIDRAAASGTGVDAVHLWAYPADGRPAVFLGAADYNRERDDVAAVYGAQFTNSGYRLTVRGLAPGTYTLVASAHGTETHAFSQWRTAVVTITAATMLSLDVPGSSVPPIFDVGGWALDLGTADGQTGIDAIHVYAQPAGSSAATFLGATTASRPRPDIASIYGSQFAASGYRMTTPALPLGTYTLIVYAHSTVSDRWISQTRAIAVRAPGRSAMAIDTPPDHAVTGEPFPIAGWAIDLDALESQGAGVDAVHVWAIDANGAGTFVGATTTGDSRPDVGNAFGPQFATAGYHLMASGLAPGTYTLVVYAHSMVTNNWTWQTRAITVRAPGTPLMALDTPTNQASTGQPFAIAGWAIDLDATTGPGVDLVHVWAIDATGAGTFVGAAPTGGARPDVGAAFGSQFATAGYNLVAGGLAPGTYQLIVYAHSTVTNSFSQARVVTVTVQ